MVRALQTGIEDFYLFVSIDKENLSKLKYTYGLVYDNDSKMVEIDFYCSDEGHLTYLEHENILTTYQNDYSCLNRSEYSGTWGKDANIKELLHSFRYDLVVKKLKECI